MIKIIKNTLIDPIKMECEECKSVFTYNFQDIKKSEEKTILGTSYHSRYIECPVCKHRNEMQKVREQNEN